MDRSLIIEKNNKELHQYKEQQTKKTTSDGLHGNQAQKRFASTRNKNKEKRTQISNVICPTCAKKHRGKPCYKETEACFGCEK